MRLKKKGVIFLGTALWAAFDVTGMSTNVQATLLVGVGIAVGYAVYRHIRRGSKVV